MKRIQSKLVFSLERFIAIPFVWLSAKFKKNDTNIDNHQSYPTSISSEIPTYTIQNSNPRIIEDATASARLEIPTNSSLSDAALRRGIEESLTQYEFDRVNRLQLEEALRASRAQQNNRSINISTGRSTTPSVSAVTIGQQLDSIRQQRLLHFRILNYVPTNVPTETSTTLSSTAVTTGSATTLPHRSTSPPRRTAEELITESSTSTTIESSQLPTQTVPPIVSSSSTGQIEEGFMLQSDQCHVVFEFADRCYQY